jgi:LuxR family transcriptional regulator, maltose regulon positive regulatory protein
MDSINEHALLLAIKFLTLAKSSGVLQSLSGDIPDIKELLKEVHEGAQRSRVPDGGGECSSQLCDPTPTSVRPLSPRQCDILKLIAHGRSNKEIARNVGITPETVKTHVKNIFIRLSVDSRTQAVSRAYNLGLIGAQHRQLFQLPSPREYQCEG